jgi:hypothetical protein
MQQSAICQVCCGSRFQKYLFNFLRTFVLRNFTLTYFAFSNSNLNRGPWVAQILFWCFVFAHKMNTCMSFSKFQIKCQRYKLFAFIYTLYRYYLFFDIINQTLLFMPRGRRCIFSRNLPTFYLFNQRINYAFHALSLKDVPFQSN